MGRVSFTDRDDCAILNFIISKNFISKVKGNRIWQEMEACGVTRHPWQAMRTRFLRSIVFHFSEVLHCIPECRRMFGSAEAIQDLQRQLHEACSTRTPSSEATLINSILTSDNSAHEDVESATEYSTPKGNSRSPMNLQQKHTPEKLPVLVDYPETQSQSALPPGSSTSQGDFRDALTDAIKRPRRQCVSTSPKRTGLGDAEIFGAVGSQAHEGVDSNSVLASKRSLPPSSLHHKAHSLTKQTGSYGRQKRTLRNRVINVDAGSTCPISLNSEKANEQSSGLSVDLDVPSSSNVNKHVCRRTLRPRNNSQRQEVEAASNFSMSDVDINSISDILSTPVDESQPSRLKTLRTRKTPPTTGTKTCRPSLDESLNPKKSIENGSQTPPLIRQKRYLDYMNLVEITSPVTDQENSLEEERRGAILSDLIPGTLSGTPRGEAEFAAVQSSESTSHHNFSEVDLMFPLMEPCEPTSVSQLLSETVQFTRLLDSFAARHRLTSTEAALLLHATSGDLATANRLIAHPDEFAPLWTPSDDACLLSTHSPVVFSVYKKFGPAEVSRRLQYLSSHT